MLERIHGLIAQGQSFAFETTCSGRSYGPLLRRCKEEGWRIKLVFLSLPGAEYALVRVTRRIEEGGHSISPETIVRPYHDGLRNMRELYLTLADEASVYDNSDKGRVLIAERKQGSDIVVYDEERWNAVMRES